jgi:hypothetical protein
MSRSEMTISLLEMIMTAVLLSMGLANNGRQCS